MVRNVLSQYGAVERSGVRHVYGCTAPSSEARIVDGIDTRADVGLVIVLVDTLHISVKHDTQKLDAVTTYCHSMASSMLPKPSGRALRRLCM